LPQLPQLFASVKRFFSHPFAAFASQLPYPAVHTMAQTPATQDGVPPAPLHTAPHAPQLLGSVFVLTSQPLAARFESQFANGALQSPPHDPAEQVDVAFA
jgi:hypothetical protein